MAAIVMLSTVVFFVVSVLVSLGLWWWTGDVTRRGVMIGVICGVAAAFAVGVVGRAMGRSGERSSDEHKRSRDGHDC
jgi:type VI protein secretion system component VasK